MIYPILSANDSLSVPLVDESATLALGAALARGLQKNAAGALIYLTGDLGAGKTTLCRGLLRGMGFGGRVKSPTYTLVELYVVSRLNLYHFDFYRFGDPEEWQEAGFRDLFNETNICLVEWPEKAGELLPPPDLTILLKNTLTAGRLAQIVPMTERGRQVLSALPHPPLPDNATT